MIDLIEAAGRKQAEEEPRRNYGLLLAVASVDKVLNASADRSLAIVNSLELLCQAAEADSAYIFEYGQSGKGEYFPLQRYAWTKDETLPLDFLHYTTLSRWREQLSTGQTIKGRLFEFPLQERALMDDLGLFSILVIPITAKGWLWGCLCFRDCHSNRAFDDAEVSILQAGAASIAGAIACKQAEDELLKSREAAESGIRAKSRFLANISHEIRTPMNAVMGMTSLLLEEDLTSEQRDNLETIRTSGEILLATINDILDFSMIEQGKLELDDRPIHLRECIEDCIEQMNAKAAEKKVKLGYHMDSHLPEIIIGDGIRLRQVLTSLLCNGVKFSDGGEVKVSVSCKPAKQGGFEIHFAVKDTGIGIPPGDMIRLFQSFSQLDSSTTRRFGGTGLGLAISKRLVEMMGGRIWAESELGAGSVFHFTILAEEIPSGRLQSNDATLSLSCQEADRPCIDPQHKAQSIACRRIAQ